MEGPFSELPRRSTRRILLESRKDFESQSPFHHQVECVDRKRKLSSGGGEGEGEGEKQWLRGGVRREQDREVTFSKRSSNTLYATRHKRKRPHLHSNSGAVAMDTIVPLRRSKREKRLLFSNLNQQEIYQHLANPHYSVIDDFSDDELDPYEKILSPIRRRRPKHPPSHPSHPSPSTPPHTRSSSRRKSALTRSVKVESNEEVAREEEEEKAENRGEEGEEGEEPKSDGEMEENGEGEGEEEEEEEEGEGEEGGRGYYLRKRRPVVYQYQPIIQVVEEDTPPKKRRQRRRASASDSSFYHKSAPSRAPRAYQSKSGSTAVVSRRIRRVAHAADSSSTSSSGSDVDEARFRQRKSRSMNKARLQCLPMNLDPTDMSQPVIRDRQRIGASLADVDPMTINREVTFDSIGGLKQHIRSLKEMILFPLLYPEVFDRFKIQPPRGVLFYGPPGCGKTLVARALANECSKGGKKVAFFMRKGADCLSKWVGESERQLRLLFDQAYQLRPSILFFDEIDGLAPVRSTRQDQIHSSIVSTLLALMDGLDSRGEIVVIGATNRIDAIDPALRRPGRFDREFLFPLPSREDRSSIISIHTQKWSPPLKLTFISQLAEQTVGYCGADLKSLCTEAALSALRRTYPQIYETGDKLILDVTSINVAATDFYVSLKKIVPTAQRSDSSVACALRDEVVPLLLRPLRSLLNLVSVVFNPAWSAVERAQTSLQAAVAMERQQERAIEECIREMRDRADRTCSKHTSLVLQTRNTGFSRGSVDTENHSLTSLSSSQINGENSQNELSDVFLSSQPGSLDEVYFNMTDIVNEVGGVESITMENTDSGENEEACEISKEVSIFKSSGTPSHPHSLPSVHRPRLLLCGSSGRGQSSHLGPALLHALEEFPVKILNLSVVFGVSTHSPEEALTQLFREAKCVAPSIIYLPRVDSWWGVTTETFQATFTSSLLSLPPSTSLIVIATAECSWRELCPSLKRLFNLSSETFVTPRPLREERHRFFARALLVKPLLPPLNTPQSDGVTQHKHLPVAPPPKPRELAPTELQKMDKQRNSVLREMRMFLRDATNKLLAERKFKEFSQPVDPGEVTDYYDIIKNPMDLGTVMKKIDEHQYTLPKQWLEDVDQITKNALEYNPEHDSDSRLLLHRAVALQDMAHSILEHELCEEFEQQCEDIEDTYRKLGRKPPNTSPLKPSSSTSKPICHTHTPSPNRNSTHTTRQGSFFKTRRRSLRQKGLQPEGEGFNYYTPSRTPRKGDKESEQDTSDPEGIEETEEEEDDGGGDGGGGGGEEREGSGTSVIVDGREEEDDPESGWDEEEGEDGCDDLCSADEDLLPQNSEEKNLCLTRRKSEIPRRHSRTAPPCASNGVGDAVRSATGVTSRWDGTAESEKGLRNSGVKHRLFHNNTFSTSHEQNDTEESSKNCRQISNLQSQEQLNRSITNGCDYTESDQRKDRVSTAASGKDKTVVSAADVVSERRWKSTRISSIGDGISSASAETPIDVLCNGPTSSDLCLGRSASTLSEDAQAPCSTEQNSNLKTNPNSEDSSSSLLHRNPVDIDQGRLLSLFERVVDGTENCSVEVMEKMLSTFEHLVFRYRLRSDRRQLSTDLELAANLFLRQPYANVHEQ